MVVTGSPPPPAPRVTNSGTKCSVLGVRVAPAGGLRENGRFVDVALFERRGRPGVELARPGRRRRVDAEVAQERQAVREKATADQEHAFVAQRREPGTERGAGAPGASAGSEISSTGTSARGYMTSSGT